VSDRPSPGYLSSGEAARLLGVCRQTVLRWARDGALHSTRTLGGHLRFRAADVENLRQTLANLGASHATSPAAEPPTSPSTESTLAEDGEIAEPGPPRLRLTQSGVTRSGE
jgi:excisionase family DNA binding protein